MWYTFMLKVWSYSTYWQLASTTHQESTFHHCKYFWRLKIYNCLMRKWMQLTRLIGFKDAHFFKDTYSKLCFPENSTRWLQQQMPQWFLSVVSTHSHAHHSHTDRAQMADNQKREWLVLFQISDNHWAFKPLWIVSIVIGVMTLCDAKMLLYKGIYTMMHIQWNNR